MKSKILLSILFLFCGLLCFSPGCTDRAGILTINLTDAPADYQEVHVTFSEISVHRAEEDDDIEEQTTDIEDDEDDEGDSNWIIISDVEQGFNLLDYQQQKKEFDLLAEAALLKGKYTQIRLKIVGGEDEDGAPKTYLKFFKDDTKYPLEVPSGVQSGLKLIHPFTISAGTVTTLYLDFDAEKSVKQTGNGQYKLKPTIAVISYLAPNQGIKGTVLEEVEAVADADVFAYIYTDDVVEDLDEDEDNDVDPDASTTTDEDGSFALPLPTGTYTLKISKAGYEDFTTIPIEVIADTWVELDPIQLEPTTP